MRILLVLAFASALSAGTIQLTGLGYGRADVALVTPSGGAHTVYATEIQVLVGGQSYLAYCVDLFTSIGMSTYLNTPGQPDSYPNGTRAAWLFETYAGLVRSNEQAAALQVALWDVVHDGGDGLSIGAIRLGTGEVALRTAADSLVWSSSGQSSMNATILYNFEIGSGGRMQTLIAFGAEPDTVGTPEPGTMALIGLGLAGMYGLERWRSRRTRI